MESQDETIIRETAEALGREMDFYKELKRRRNVMSIWQPKAELTQQQAIAYQQSTCDPVLRDVAKTVLEEIQYYRNQRSVSENIKKFHKFDTEFYIFTKLNFSS